MTSLTSLPTADEARELPEPPCPPQLVEELLRHFVRAVKAHQLYLPNNPIYQRSIENLRGAFAPLWAHIPELVLQISENELRWFGRAVLHESSRAESLPWVFYKDGLRELTISQGFEGDELAALLDILQRVRKASPDEDDLLTLLWEQEFAYLRYRFIDIGLDAAAPIEPSELTQSPRTVPIVEVQRDVEEEPRQADRPGIVRLEELDATLYFLDEHEIEYLRAEVQKEQTVNHRLNVLAIVLDIFETQPAPAVREEVCGILEGFMVHLLAHGDYGAVAYLLREVNTVLERTRDLPPAIAARLAKLPESLSDPTVLAQLLRSLDEASTLPPQEDLDALFQQLRAGTLGTVLGWLKQAQNRELRTLLERTAARLASMNTAEMLKLILSDDVTIAVEAMRRAADLKTPAAVGQLAKVMTLPNVTLRQTAAQALAEIGSPGALRVLENALDDEDRDVRVTAVRAIGARGHRAALPKVEAVVKGRAVREADLTEKMAYFETYALLAHENGVEPLDDLLNSRSPLLRRRLDPEIRACAAMALGKIGTERAVAALRRAAGDKDVRVQSAINRALRGGGSS
ncbi:MAG: HEAT repeat domain-containing protein [Gemmatimonadaceae bacterium]|nr:HEAT repeat domain-containing protein [Gemmatimonadaceae bacterium]